MESDSLYVKVNRKYRMAIIIKDLFLKKIDYENSSSMYALVK